MIVKAGQPEGMKALLYDSFGDPGVLRWADTPEPGPGAGQVRIAVRAASLNPMDWKIFSGAMAAGKPLDGPGYVGLDASGIVDAVGQNVSGVSAGDAVLGLGHATMAEFAVLSAWAPKPDAIDWPTAASAVVGGEASERALRLLGVPGGGTVFMDGASGGVGTVAVQFGRARGLTVIASGAPEDQGYLRELGATPVVYGEGVAGRVRNVAGGELDGVFDIAGKTPAKELISLVRTPSQVVSIADFAAAKEGVRVTSAASGDSRPARALAETADLLGTGQLTIGGQTFPAAQAADAYRLLMAGHVRGKLALTI